MLRRLLSLSTPSFTGIRPITFNRFLSCPSKPTSLVERELGVFLSARKATEGKNKADGRNGEPQDDLGCLLLGKWDTPAAQGKAEVISDLFKKGYDHPDLREHVMELFEHWMLANNKSYSDATEKTKRFSIFFADVLTIMRMNSNRFGSAKFGINHFSDMTWEEVKPQSSNRYRGLAFRQAKLVKATKTTNSKDV